MSTYTIFYNTSFQLHYIKDYIPDSDMNSDSCQKTSKHTI